MAISATIACIPVCADVGTTARQFNVPVNGNHTETFSGAPTFTAYSVELSCKDASGQQKGNWACLDVGGVVATAGRRRHKHVNQRGIPSYTRDSDQPNV